MASRAARTLRSSTRSITPEQASCSRCLVPPATLSIARSTSASNCTRQAGARAYATEATVIPKSVLYRSPPPPPPTTQLRPPETATSLESQPGQGQTIDSMLYEIHERVFAEHASCARLPDLYDQLSSKAGRVLDDELRFEDTPSEDRAIKRTSEAQLTWHQSMELAKDRLRNPAREKPHGLAEDGLVLVCHMVDAKPLPIASWSLGFVIKTNDNRHHVVSCSHTLESAVHAYRSSGCTSSSTFIATRAGALCPITSIASSLPLHDIVLYDFAPSTDDALHTVPVALHPPQSGNTQSLFSVADNAWRQANIIGYKDPRGNDAEPGTYDELNSISIDFIPTPGSSGGPLVSSNGAVTGLIRGSRMAYGERRSVGFATPAEKIFEMFQLPGLPRRSS